MKWRLAFGLVLCLASAAPGAEGDWPTYGNGVQRQHSTPHQLPEDLRLEWQARFPAPQPVWPSEDRLHIDLAYEPVLSGDFVYLGLNGTDRLVALDLETGAEVWSFPAGGPIRRPPAVHNGAVYFASDDGYCYCLDSATGRVRWKYFGGPAHKYVLGNGRLISQWAARAGVLVKEGTVYFASGVWPFMGTFVQALDAETGRVVWQNTDSSNFYSLHPHGGMGISGLSPQGTMALCGNTLLVSNGRARPMRFNADTGERLPYETGWQSSGWLLTGAGDKYFNGAYLLDLESCTLGYCLADGSLRPWAYRPVVEGDAAWVPGRKVIRYDLNSKPMPVLPLDHKLRRDYEYRQTKVHGALDSRVLEESPECDRVWIKTGGRLFAGKGGELMALDPEDGTPLWSHSFEAEVGSVIAGRGKLLVSTCDGTLHCFGGGGGQPRTIVHGKTAEQDVAPGAAERAARILAGGSSGICLVAGVEDGELVKALVLRGDFYRVVAADGDAAAMRKLRADLDAMGLYGTKVDLMQDSIEGLPPYLMNLICSEKDLSAFDPGVIFSKLRPYGGRACFESPKVRAQIEQLNLGGARVRERERMTVLARTGPLPGAAPWTHDNGTPANTLSSEDSRVRGPLGVTWYGGAAGGDYFADRHKGAPRPQVVDGRVLCQKKDLLTAYDAYTGELLWQREIPGMAGFLADRDRSYTPRAFIVMGNNMVSLPDTVYVKTPTRCLLLEPATGETRAEFALPDGEKWGTISVLDDVLVAQADTLANRERGTEASSWHEGLTYRFGFGADPWNGAVHRELFALDRHSGEVLWSRKAGFAYRSNALALGNGRVFLVDLATEGMAERFEEITADNGRATLLALDLRTGTQIWRQDEGVSDTWLGYSREADVVVGVPDATIRGWDETAISGRDGSTGELLWQRTGKHMPGVVIVGDRYFGNGANAYDVRTNSYLGFGTAKGRGCDNPLAGVNMMTFRTSTSGYLDLADGNGLVALPGFRPSCNGSLIPADGLLNAPKVATGCVCNYSIKTTLALAPMPDAALWGAARGRAGADRIGINFGAPGDRVSEEKTTFFQFPVTAWRREVTSPIQDEALVERDGKERDLVISTVPREPRVFQKPSLCMAGQDMAWVGASGLKGVEEVRLHFGRLKPERAGVRLYFAEFEAEAAGERVFEVAVNGKKALKRLDIFREAGGAGRVLVKDVARVKLKGDLTISLSPHIESPLKEPVLSGIELVWP